MERVRVFVADEQPIFLQGIHWTLQQEKDMEFVGASSEAQSALQAIETLTPDVVLVDVGLPVRGALASLQGERGVPTALELGYQIRHRLPHTAVVVMTAFEDEEQLFQSIRVGAAAYCPRDIQPQELVAVIRRVSQGDYLINDSVLARPQVASRVLKQFRELTAAAAEAEPLYVPLSAREVEILDYIARGNSNKEIARALKISDQTVKNHITSILRKLQVNDRTQAVVYALRHGWIKMTDA